MASYINKKVVMTYTTNHSQNAWAYIQTAGWRKIKTGAPDGVTNLFIMLCAAKANNRLVNVYTDAPDKLITAAYLK